VAQLQGGVGFINEAGIWKIDRNTNVYYIGKMLKRMWDSRVNHDYLSEISAHNYAVGRQFKLSVPILSDSVNSEVFVYDYTKETTASTSAAAGMGAWTRYDNHPAVGWAAFGNDSFFGTTDGQVFRVRTADDASDYRDDSAAISAEITDKGRDFGIEGIRKLIQSVVHQFRFATDFDVTISAATNMGGTFDTIKTVSLRLDAPDTNYDDLNNDKIITRKTPVPHRKAQFLQMKWVESTKDQTVILSGADFCIAALRTKGITNA
jgi:hypothetical protein